MNTITHRVKGMSGLVSALGVVLGREPEPGLMLLLESDSGIVVTVCFSPSALSDEGWTRFAQELSHRGELAGARSAIAMAYRLDPGEVDLAQVVSRLETVVPIHHALTVTAEHWWVVSCEPGCCDGAVHPRPDTVACDLMDRDSDRTESGTLTSGGGRRHPVLTAERIDAAWRKISAVSAAVAERDGWSNDLVTVCDALAEAATRDRILTTLVPNLMAPEGLGIDHHGPVPEPVSPGDLVAWLPQLRPADRSCWHALIALASWRDGDTAQARVHAARALRHGGTSLACLMSDILAAGMTYETCLGGRSNPGPGVGCPG